MTKYKNYTDTDIINAVQSSVSIRQALIQLNLRPTGGNYRTLHNAIERLNVNIDHFAGQQWSKGKIIGPKEPIEIYLSNIKFIQSHKLKLRLLKERILTHVCSSCGLTEWLQKPIPLELDHINGKHKDNSLCNIRLLCPNCHALTSNYRGKNKGKA